jgi:cell division protein FtsZ
MPAQLLQVRFGGQLGTIPMAVYQTEEAQYVLFCAELMPASGRDVEHIEGAKGILVNVTGGNDFTLSEYEEILRIITANADEDALIIAGTTIDETLDDEIRVTVIATGFSPSGIHAQKGHGEEGERTKKSDYISLDEWVKLTSGKPSKGTEDLFPEDLYKDDELGIPAVLRYRKVSGGKNGN